MALTKLNYTGQGTIPIASIPTITGDKMPTGSVLQVVNAYHTASTEISTSYTTYLNPSITPILTSSKILILVTICIDMIGDSSFFAQFKRSIGGASETNLNPDIGASFYGSGNFGSANQHGLGYSITTIDSPNTTGSIEYRLQLKENNRAILSSSGDTSIVLMEIAG